LDFPRLALHGVGRVFDFLAEMAVGVAQGAIDIAVGRFHLPPALPDALGLRRRDPGCLGRPVASRSRRIAMSAIVEPGARIQIFERFLSRYTVTHDAFAPSRVGSDPLKVG